MTVFQVAFGLTVFAITRQYYIRDTDEVIANPTAVRQTVPEWPENSAQSDLEQLISAFPGQPIIGDTGAITRQADEYFSEQQYDRAADLYEQLLAAGLSDVKIYNNLGITLHYLGRSAEALHVLNEGVAVDPAYQRIWLTLGFVNSQTGNTVQARSALTTAVQMGADSEVGQSATTMLNTLGSD
jgi:predicted Zn-dependent protease